MSDPRLLQLHPGDNVGIALRSLEPGDVLELGGVTVVVPQRIMLGHKLALTAIRRGGRVVKYGAAIGSATDDIAAGDHVHVHNLKSDYLPTYTLEENRRYAERH